MVQILVYPFASTTREQRRADTRSSAEDDCEVGLASFKEVLKHERVQHWLQDAWLCKHTARANESVSEVTFLSCSTSTSFSTVPFVYWQTARHGPAGRYRPATGKCRRIRNCIRIGEVILGQQVICISLRQSSD